jgi:hypothetical protein
MKSLWIGGAVVVVALIVIFIGRFHASNSVQDISPYIRSQLSDLLREGYQYAVMCEQDKNLLLALMHCSAALTRLDAVEQIASPAWVQQALGNDSTHYRRALTDKLNRIVSRINKRYPKIGLRSSFTACAGWLVA